MQGKIIKIVSSKYTVSLAELMCECVVKKALKNRIKLLVGDNVILEKFDEQYVIVDVLKRANELIRPNVANIDQMLITISLVPKTDFVLVDKLILSCKSQNIEPIICVNKSDLFIDKMFINYIKSQYKNSVKDIIAVSAKTKENIDSLIDVLKNKTTALSGQSAVGKTSIINAIKPTLLLEQGDLSLKIMRGKNTTRITQIYQILPQTYCIDTPGFSMLTLNEQLYGVLNEFYFKDKIEVNCKYSDCDHINSSEKDCSVLRALKEDKIDKSAYNRYMQLLCELKKDKENKYK